MFHKYSKNIKNWNFKMLTLRSDQYELHGLVLTFFCIC